jgi:hypothetical protein
MDEFEEMMNMAMDSLHMADVSLPKRDLSKPYAIEAPPQVTVPGYEDVAQETAGMTDVQLQDRMYEKAEAEGMYTPPITVAMLKNDPTMAAASRDVYQLFEGKPFEGSDADAVQYGIDVMGEFTFNFAGPVGIELSGGQPSPGGTLKQAAALIGQGDANKAQAFLYVMDQYDRLSVEAEGGFSRMFKGLVADPSNWAAAVTLGGSKILQMGGQTATKQGIKYQIRQLAKTATEKVAKYPAVAAGVGEAVRAGATEERIIGIEEEAGAEIVPEEKAARIGIASAIGGLTGAGFVKGAEVTGKGLKAGIEETVMPGVRNFVEGAEGRMLAREADTSVQLNAGVDVPAAIDKAIVGAQKLMGKTEDIVAAPETARAHRTPAPLLIQGSGEKPTTPVVQKFTKGKEQEVITNIDTALQNNPDAVKTIDGWKAFTQQTFGGDYLPHPPVVAMKYAQSPEAIAEKLNALTPELKAGVDEGFGYVKNIRNIYQSGEADPTMTADLFVWGILSRGAGPVQQEAAFIDIMEDAAPLIQKVADGTFDEADMNFWIDNMKKSLPEGSPSKQVTMNVNATGKLLFELSKKPQGSNRTVLEIMHDMISDPDVPAKDIRRQFMTLTESAGIDNKVVSFILLVSGRDDVLVMDRIQGRHLWDDGKFGGANIYDGIGKNNEGLNGIFKGPRGLLVTEAMEDAMRPNIQSAYEMIGRPEDGTLGRFHWESWVIEGEQVVSHSTLQAIEKRTPRGFGVTEGKTDEYASGFRYIRGEAGPVQRYPLSDGSFVYMTPVQAKEFLSFVKNPKSGIVPKGFKVTERADVPWYERTEVNRQKLDEAARRFENATPEGELLSSSEGAE